MRLIIANCTKQHHDFVFRVPESANARERRQHIPHGQQMYVHDDCSLPIIMGIVQQHERYGLIAAKDIPKNKGFIGLCYSIDKPIDIDAIMTAAEHNDGVKTDEAIEQRKEMAIAIRDALSNAETGVTSLDMEIVQDAKSASDTDRFAHGVSVQTPGKRSKRNRE